MEEDGTDLIACCGLYCGDCHGYRGKVADLARDLRKELRDSKYREFALFASEKGFNKALKDYDTAYDVLGAMVKFRCRKGCRNGGGPPFCKMRKCSGSKGFEGCWECPDFQTCTKLDFLRPVHGDAHIKNLRTLCRKGKEEFVKGKREW